MNKKIERKGKAALYSKSTCHPNGTMASGFFCLKVGKLRRSLKCYKKTHLFPLGFSSDEKDRARGNKKYRHISDRAVSKSNPNQLLKNWTTQPISNHSKTKTN